MVRHRIIAGMISIVILTVLLTGCSKEFIDWAAEYETSTSEYTAPIEKLYVESKKDLSPVTTKVAIAYYNAIATGDSYTFMQLLGYPTDLFDAEQFKVWCDVNGLSFPIKNKLTDIKVETTILDDENATVSFQVLGEEKEIVDEFIVTLWKHAESLTLMVEPPATGFMYDQTIRIPGKLVEINQQPFTNYITDTSDGFTTLTFDTLPEITFTAQYKTSFGEYTTDLEVLDGVLMAYTTIPDERAIVKYVEAGNVLMNQLWHYLWDEKSRDMMLTVLESEETVDALLYKLPDIKEKNITFVELSPTQPEDGQLPSTVIGKDIIRLPIRYFVKFNINLGSMVATKDFSWIELRLLDDGTWKLHDIGIEGKEAVLTYLDPKNNKW